MKPYEIILQQIGGKTFIAFTGAYNILHFGDNILRFRFRGSEDFDFCSIAYKPFPDLYEMRIGKVGEDGQLANEQVMDGVYFDQLVEIFERTTGVFAHM